MTAVASPLELCACPHCHGALRWSSSEARCLDCGAAYASVSGVPILVAAGGGDPGDHYKQTQASFFDEQPAEWETHRPHGAPAMYGWLMGEKFRRSLDGLEAVLEGATALTVCGGSGMDAEFLARRGIRVLASDISLGSALRTQRRALAYGLPITPIVADAEALPFAARSIDLVYVHDGLHHLQDPLLGLEEMIRVTRRALSLTEPARAAATAVSVKLGISMVEEDAGNRVERLDPQQVVDRLRGGGLEIVGRERYAMYYQHEPGPMVRLLSRRRLRAPAQAGFSLANGLIGGAGNKLSVRAVRPRPVPGQ